MARYSQAQNRATQKYIKSAYDEIKIRMPKGKRDIIKEHADSLGESANAFINRAIDEAMQRDKSQE